MKSRVDMLLKENNTLQVKYAAARLEIASLESQLEAVGTGGWMRNGALLYRLTDERRPANFDEIRVTMANGSRDIGQTSSRAERLLVMLSAPQPTPQALGAAGDDVQPHDQQAMGLCHACGWKGVLDYPDGPVCVACEHDKTLAPQPTAQALHVAATSCPHEIDKDKRVLHFDSKQPGKNALAQLAARLQAAVPAIGQTLSGGPTYREDFLQLAQKCGAVLTGKPDASEAITVVFSVDAWRAFDLATAQAMWVLGRNECLDAAIAAQQGDAA